MMFGRNPSGAASRVRAVLLRLLLSPNLVLYLCIAWFLAMLLWRPEVGSPRNLWLLVLGSLPLLAVSVGQTFVLISGGIDLSITAVISLLSVLGAMVATGQTPLAAGGAVATALAIALMMATGAAIGGFHGIAVAWLRMPPFLVTLTTLMFAAGVAVWIAGAQPISGLPESLVHLWYGSFLGIPPALWIVGLLTAGAHGVLAHTVSGRWLYAVGMNRKTSTVSGVPVGGVTVMAYAISGLCAAVAAVLLMARLESGSPQLVRQEFLLDCIGAVVIGGTSLFGGRGTIRGTLFGVLFITLLGNSLSLLNLSHWHEQMVKGSVILLAATIDALRSRYLV
jgi:ribose/xylose/arabinose/galactoside ABC-type transport system permease subunit